jgi:hypothetical protein
LPPAEVVGLLIWQTQTVLQAQQVVSSSPYGKE